MLTFFGLVMQSLGEVRDEHEGFIVTLPPGDIHLYWNIIPCHDPSLARLIYELYYVLYFICKTSRQRLFRQKRALLTKK